MCCMLCVEIIKGRMSAYEVRRAGMEFTPPKGHEEELEAVVGAAFTQEQLDEADILLAKDYIRRAVEEFRKDKEDESSKS